MLGVVIARDTANVRVWSHVKRSASPEMKPLSWCNYVRMELVVKRWALDSPTRWSIRETWRSKRTPISRESARAQMLEYARGLSALSVATPYILQSNSIVEWKNRTLMDIVNCMLRSSGATENLWGEALLSSCFILNRVFRKDYDITPYDCWKGRTPNIQFFKVWGCLPKGSIHEPKKKIGFKTVDAIFIRYAHDSNVNWFLVVNAEIVKYPTTPS